MTQNSHLLVQISMLFCFVSTLVALVLLAAGTAKLANWREFIEVVRNYQLLPARASTLMGYLLPITELIIGITLVFGLFTSLSLLIALSLFLMFGSAVAINLIRGRSDISCGCFGPGQGHKLTWNLVTRNAMLAGLAALAWLIFLGLNDVVYLSLQETIAIKFSAGAALVSWWLWGVILRVWHLHLPAQGYLQQHRRENH
jgi:uncharacterized membrane protein YphA (DoxX/SURF4 family)